MKYKFIIHFVNGETLDLGSVFSQKQVENFAKEISNSTAEWYEIEDYQIKIDKITYLEYPAVRN